MPHFQDVCQHKSAMQELQAVAEEKAVENGWPFTSLRQRENAIALARYIATGQTPWNMSKCRSCFFGQYVGLTGGGDEDGMFAFLGLPKSGPIAELLVTPEGFGARVHNPYPAERAIGLLIHLAQTGEVAWPEYVFLSSTKGRNRA